MVPLHLVQEFDDLDVWCRCKGCREWKPVAHYLLFPNSNNRTAYGSWRQCAACRARTPHAEWEKAS